VEWKPSNDSVIANPPVDVIKNIAKLGKPLSGPKKNKRAGKERLGHLNGKFFALLKSSETAEKRFGRIEASREDLASPGKKVYASQKSLGRVIGH